MRPLALSILVACLAAAVRPDPAHGQSSGFGIGSGGGTLLSRIPRTGAVPPMYDASKCEDVDVLAKRAEIREYLPQLKAIRRKHFEGRPRTKVREEGLRQLREFTDPASFKPMLLAFRGSSPETLLDIYALLAERGAEGEAALAWEAMRSDDRSVRNEIVARLTRPPSEAVLREIDHGLRDNRHLVANAAGYVAGALGAIQAIPLLIFAQATEDLATQQGDLAWIVIGTQTSYVANVIPVVGDNSGAFQPVLGLVMEGTLLRVMDAVVVNYRIDVHNSLVSMTSGLSGGSTEFLGYDMPRWYAWYNDTLLPKLAEREKMARMLEDVAGTAGGSTPSGGTTGGAGGGGVGPGGGGSGSTGSGDAGTGGGVGSPPSAPR